MTYPKNTKLTPDLEILIRIFSRLQVSTTHFYKGEPCWITHYALQNKGYVEIKFKNVRNSGHKLMYRFFVDAIPGGFTIDHLCRNRACVNPVHLEAVTSKENVLRGEGITALNARKTHCKRGHLLPSEPNEFGARQCRICQNFRSREWRKHLTPKQHEERLAQRRDLRRERLMCETTEDRIKRNKRQKELYHLNKHNQPIEG